MSYSSTHTEFWSGISLSATREASMSKVLLETPEGMKESAEKERTPRALVNEGIISDKRKGAQFWSHIFGGSLIS